MRNCSITPKLTPEPPWTATPAGLSIASKPSSSNRTGNCTRRHIARPRLGLADGLGLGIGPLRGAHRRQPDLVPGRDPALGAGPPLVDPHLAAADDAVDMGLGHALEMAHQEIVQPLAGVLVVDQEHPRNFRVPGTDCPL